MSEDDEYPMVIVCAGPPLCLLEDEAAILAQNMGCEFCRRIVCHPDGSETIIERTVN